MTSEAPAAITRLCAEEGTDDPREAILRRARGLLEKIGRFGPVRLPVDMEAIASFAGIGTVDDIRGLAVVAQLRPSLDGQRLHVDVRAEDSIGRRRFSLGHEVGHTLVPGLWTTACNGGGDTGAFGSEGRGIEGLCDVAAAELLLPTAVAVPWLANRPFNIETVFDLASEAAASLEATGRRLVDLSARPLGFAVVQYRLSKRQQQQAREVEDQSVLPGFTTGAPEAKFRVDWLYRGPDGPFVPKEKSLDPEAFLAARTSGFGSGDVAVVARGRSIRIRISAALAPVRVAGILRERYLVVLADR
jgi:hypothetical protein